LRLGRRGRNHGGSDLCVGPAVPAVLPGERKEFPVVFFVDPAMAGDEDARDIAAITLSSTFYNKGRVALEE
jgi:cytochrome c oxidase assembly protein Cox11